MGFLNNISARRWLVQWSWRVMTRCPAEPFFSACKKVTYMTENIILCCKPRWLENNPPPGVPRMQHYDAFAGAKKNKKNGNQKQRDDAWDQSLQTAFPLRHRSRDFSERCTHLWNHSIFLEYLSNLEPSIWKKNAQILMVPFLNSHLICLMMKIARHWFFLRSCRITI